MTGRLTGRFLIVALLLSGCMAEGDAGDADGPGAEIYQGYCAVCHGPNGKGAGLAADDLPVPPADLTTLAARNGGVFPASDVMAKIYGYPEQFHEQIMPEFGPVLAGEEVMWTDETGAKVKTPKPLIDLVEYLESLQG